MRILTYASMEQFYADLGVDLESLQYQRPCASTRYFLYHDNKWKGLVIEQEKRQIDENQGNLKFSKYFRIKMVFIKKKILDKIISTA